MFFYNIKISEIYFENLVKQINPKIGIGHEMDKKIFLFKKFLPDKFSLGYQHSFIFEGAINSFYKKKFQKKKSRLLFCIRRQVEKNYE